MIFESDYDTTLPKDTDMEEHGDNAHPPCPAHLPPKYLGGALINALHRAWVALWDVRRDAAWGWAENNTASTSSAVAPRAMEEGEDAGEGVGR
jgi:hypothetical protein